MLTDSVAAAIENRNSSPSCAPSASAVRYDNVHDLKHVGEVVGWNLEYHQIEPGQFAATVAAKRVGDITVVIKELELLVEVLGTPPDDHVTVISPDTGETIWANGFRLEDSDALLLRPDANVHIVGGPTVVVLAHVPFSLLGKVGMSDSALQSLDSRDGALFVDTAAAAGESLRWLTNTSMYMDGRCAGQESWLAVSAGNVIRQAIEQQRDGVPRSEGWRTIKRAREYIESNLHQPIRMRHVSDYAAASISKLERTFQRELCITPSRYILARRLHAVNRELGSVMSGGAKVSDLAMEYGFSHLGRFSAAYRAQFGELPSQTLQAGA